MAERGQSHLQIQIRRPVGPRKERHCRRRGARRYAWLAASGLGVAGVEVRQEMREEAWALHVRAMRGPRHDRQFGVR